MIKQKPTLKQAEFSKSVNLGQIKRLRHIIEQLNTRGAKTETQMESSLVAFVASGSTNNPCLIVAEAKKIARRVDSWIELSNALNHPQRGLITRYFPIMAERHEFLLSPEYEELDRMLLRLIKRKGLYPRSRNGQDEANGKRQK